MSGKPGFPSGKVLGFGSPSLVTACILLAEQFLSSQPWWPELPWLCLFLVSVAFLAGGLWSDYHYDLALRRWFRSRMAHFELEGVHPTHSATPDIERLVLRVKLRFKRPVNGRLVLIAHQNVNLRNRPTPAPVYELSPKSYIADESVALPIATVFLKQPAPSISNFWGDDKTNPSEQTRLLLIGASENLAEIRLIVNGRVKQRHRVFFVVFSKGEGWLGRVFAISEESELFGND